MTVRLARRQWTWKAAGAAAVIAIVAGALAWRFGFAPRTAPPGVREQDWRPAAERLAEGSDWGQSVPPGAVLSPKARLQVSRLLERALTRSTACEFNERGEPGWRCLADTPSELVKGLMGLRREMPESDFKPIYAAHSSAVSILDFEGGGFAIRLSATRGPPSESGTPRVEVRARAR